MGFGRRNMAVTPEEAKAYAKYQLEALKAFADRAYNDDGTLVSRKLPGSVIKDKDLATKRVVRMVKEGKVESINGNDIEIKEDSICVHSNKPKALEFVKNIRETLIAEGVEQKKQKSNMTALIGAAYDYSGQQKQEDCTRRLQTSNGTDILGIGVVILTGYSGIKALPSIHSMFG